MFKQYRQLITGIVIGAVVAGSGAAFADSSVQAILSNSTHFKFDGAEKQLPDGYSVLSYQDHMYVPARFVAEQLGAKVDWDGNTNTVLITSSGSSSSSGSSGSSSSGQKVGHYTFSNYSMSSDDIATKVIGEITNNDTTRHSVEIKINFYDANGKLIDSASGAVMNIDPGQKKSFEAYANSILTGVNTYSFQIDLET